MIDHSEDYMYETSLNYTTNTTEQIIMNTTIKSILVNTNPVYNPIYKLCYFMGIFGNLIAIIILRKGDKRVRNRKYLLMLTSLAANDLVALLGMMATMVTHQYYPQVEKARWFCGIRVIMRIFGIGSVCIAVTMALERLVALTQPFLYQRHVTYLMIKSSLLGLWLFAAFLTCLPLLGVGRYYNPYETKCERYRNAHEHLDIGYAVFYVFFGTILCLVLVYCNLAVIKALYNISSPNSQSRLAVRRISKNSSKSKLNSCYKECPKHNTATAEEVSFSYLMAILSAFFMICWLPQMVTSTIYLISREEDWPKLDKRLSRISDLLMLLNYNLNPVLYVLIRWDWRSLRRRITKAFKKGNCWQNHKSSTDSIKTSCCPQESLTTEHTSSADQKIIPMRSYHDEQDQQQREPLNTERIDSNI